MKFSALVRDFMADLTGPVLATKAEVSHYIGDEAVITWQMERGLANANCLRLFFLFQSRLESRRAYYERNYGLLPGFKAGAHFGQVVTTEVGEIKSEIVYHGDVLNTAARIQGMCAGLGEEFLISGELAAKLGSREGLRSLGSFGLKGREREVELVAVNREGSVL